MVDLPIGVKWGEAARLFTVVSETSKEKRAIGVTLAVMPKIDELSKRLLETVNVKIGKRADVKCYSEIVFENEDEASTERPDGLIVVNTSRSTWSAIVEAKIGGAKLSDDQIKRYAELAKTHGVDAVITISNEFTAQPDHHPTTVLRGALAKKVSLFHWPWMWLRTQAELIQLEEAVCDPEQAFILNEYIRFLEHPSTGIEKFKQMPKEWKDAVSLVRDGGGLARNSEQVSSVVSAWNQEVRDLALDVARHIGTRVELKLSKAEKENSNEWLKSGCERLASDNVLQCVLQIPDTAGDLEIVADLRARTLTCSMKVTAPKDKQRTTSKLNWLVRQLKGCENQEIQIRAIRPGKAYNTQERLTVLREKPEKIEHSSPDKPPVSFEILLTRDLAGKFGASQKFIDELEELVPMFYDNAVQYVKAWQPQPPKPVASRADIDDETCLESADPE